MIRNYELPSIDYTDRRKEYSKHAVIIRMKEGNERWMTAAGNSLYLCNENTLPGLSIPLYHYAYLYLEERKEVIDILSMPDRYTIYVY